MSKSNRTRWQAGQGKEDAAQQGDSMSHVYLLTLGYNVRHELEWHLLTTLHLLSTTSLILEQGTYSNKVDEA